MYSCILVVQEDPKNLDKHFGSWGGIPTTKLVKVSSAKQQILQNETNIFVPKEKSIFLWGGGVEFYIYTHIFEFLRIEMSFNIVQL